jgi:hypothetical protein
LYVELVDRRQLVAMADEITAWFGEEVAEAEAVLAAWT